MILVWSRRAVRAHEGVVRKRKSQWTTDFFVNYGFRPRLTSLLSIGYVVCFPLARSVGVRIGHHHRIQPRPQFKVIFRYLRPDAPVSTSTVFTAPVDKVTFRQSPCWYPWADAAVSTCTNSQHLWSRRSYQSTCNNIRHIHTRRSR